jgi:hypothetical protein
MFVRGYFRPPEIGGDGRDELVEREAQSIPRGCKVAFLAAVVLIAALIGYVGYLEIGDRLAVKAAKNRCTADQVLQVRQPNVWATYLRQLPPTEPYGDFLMRLGQVRASMGITMQSHIDGYDNVLVLSNAKGEIAHLRYVSAATWWTFEGPHAQLFSCFEHSPGLYAKRDAF